MNFKVLCLILVFVLASISVSFAVSENLDSINAVDIDKDKLDASGLVEGKDYVINEKGEITIIGEDVSPGDYDLKVNGVENISKNDNTNSKSNNSEYKTETSYFLQQGEWYIRNVDKLKIREYLVNHDYFDGSTIDLPEDPFPYKDSNFTSRTIVYIENNPDVLFFEHLDKFLKYGRGSTNESHWTKTFGIGGSNTQPNQTKQPNLLTTSIKDSENTTVNNQSNIMIKNNHESNGTSSKPTDNPEKLNNPIANAQTLEKTGLPIAILVLVVLFVFGLRRKD